MNRADAALSRDPFHCCLALLRPSLRAKRSNPWPPRKDGLLGRCAPRNDGGKDRGADATRWNVTPPSRNESTDAAQLFALAASRTAAISATLNGSPLMMSLGPLMKVKLQLGRVSSGSPDLPVLTGIPMIWPQCPARTCGCGLSISTPISACVTSLRIDFCQSGPAGG